MNKLGLIQRTEVCFYVVAKGLLGLEARRAPCCRCSSRAVDIRSIIRLVQPDLFETPTTVGGLRWGFSFVRKPLNRSRELGTGL